VKAATDGGLQLAFCWAHTRRKFYDVHEATKSPLAGEALRRIAELYAIEADIRGQTADERRTVRQERSRLGRADACLADRDPGPDPRPVNGTVQRLGGSCRPRNHRMWIDENLKSVAEP
jgi:Transposase IS66 family